MKPNEGRNPVTEGLARPPVRQTTPPEFPSLQWIHVIYDHSDDESDLEHDLEDAPPLHRPASLRHTLAAL